MASPFTRVHPALALIAARPDREPSLAALARRAGVSPFHLHRLFSGVAGETPKAYSLRLRLSHGAALLLTGDASVLDIALTCGFRNHESFTRAFKRLFGLTPSAYRSRGFAAGRAPADPSSHVETIARTGPCVRLYHAAIEAPLSRSIMAYEIVRKELTAQPVLVVRRRVPRSGIAAAIGEALGHIFEYAQRKGIALTGHPFTRYVDVGAGLLTIEPGMRIAGSHDRAVENVEAWRSGATDTGVVEDVLPSGPAATTIHRGPYETLADAYAELETWIEAQGAQRSGAPWESYLTDPVEQPDPMQWQTEVSWPIKS
jgi:AraC-like DNA-binding protein/effector-binding domain-containing protein